MRTLDDTLDQYAYHPATPDTAPRFGALRDATMGFTREVWGLVPEGPEKTLAFRALQQFLMYANLAVALTTPADLTNQAVARVLPTDGAVSPATQPLRDQHIVNGECYGPVAKNADKDSGRTTSVVCHFGLCDWRVDHPEHDLSLAEWQVAHNGASKIR